jgi:ATP-dependent Clp protease ATP-binding subunit ClpA
MRMFLTIELGDFADYGKRVVVGQDHAIDTIQKVLIANTKLGRQRRPKKKQDPGIFPLCGTYWCGQN